MRSSHEEIIELDGYSDELYHLSKAIFDENNAPYTKPYEKKEYRVAIKYDDKIIGGLTGYSGFDWFYIETLVVAKEHRGKDYATKLIKMAENEAKKQNCVGIWLHTISFQAPDFYKKMGYEEFEKLKDMPRGHERVFFRKYL